MQNTQNRLLDGVVWVSVVTNINTKLLAKSKLQNHLNNYLSNLVTSMSSCHTSKSEKDSLNISLVAYKMSCDTTHCIPVWRGPQITANVNLRQRSSNHLIPNKPLCLNEIVLYLVANSVPRANKVIVDWTVNRLQHVLKVRVLNFNKSNMTIDHPTSKAIAKLVNINNCH